MPPEFSLFYAMLAVFVIGGILASIGGLAWRKLKPFKCHGGLHFGKLNAGGYCWRCEHRSYGGMVDVKRELG